jgi:hypothetical protein
MNAVNDGHFASPLSYDSESRSRGNERLVQAAGVTTRRG